jgi:ankyrin repeat protein
MVTMHIVHGFIRAQTAASFSAFCNILDEIPTLATDVREPLHDTLLHFLLNLPKLSDVDESKLMELVKRGANVNATNRNNCTPFHYAVYHGFSRIVREFLKNDADTKIVSGGEEYCHSGTPIYLAYMKMKHLTGKLYSNQEFLGAPREKLIDMFINDPEFNEYLAIYNMILEKDDNLYEIKNDFSSCGKNTKLRMDACNAIPIPD